MSAIATRATYGLCTQLVGDVQRSEYRNQGVGPCEPCVVRSCVHVGAATFQNRRTSYSLFFFGVYSEIEMIHRATQWARDLDKDVLYLPHRVGGKLHVLKIENGFAAASFDEGESPGGVRNLEENGRVISVDFFVKGDHARYASAPVSIPTFQ